MPLSIFTNYPKTILNNNDSKPASALKKEQHGLYNVYTLKMLRIKTLMAANQQTNANNTTHYLVGGTCFTTTAA